MERDCGCELTGQAAQPAVAEAGIFLDVLQLLHVQP